MKAIELNLKKDVIYRMVNGMKLFYMVNCCGTLYCKKDIDNEWTKSKLSLYEMAEIELEEYSPKINWAKVPRDIDILVRDRDCEEWRPAKFLMSKKSLGCLSKYPYVAYYFTEDNNLNVSNFAEAKIKGEIKPEWLKNN